MTTPDPRNEVEPHWYADPTTPDPLRAALDWLDKVRPSGYHVEQAAAVLEAALADAALERSEDIFDRLMVLCQEPWSELAFGEAQMLVARLRTDPAPLDAAWAAVEAALPDGWTFALSPYHPGGWEAYAYHWDETPGAGSTGRRTRAIYGDTPAAALRALAARLAKERDQG